MNIFDEYLRDQLSQGTERFQVTWDPEGRAIAAEYLRLLSQGADPVFRRALARSSALLTLFNLLIDQARMGDKWALEMLPRATADALLDAASVFQLGSTGRRA